MAFNEGYLEQNPIDDITLKPPDTAPIEPYTADQIHAFVKVLDHDWQVAATTRQKMLAARDKAVIFLFLDSFIILEECFQLKVPDIDLNSQRVQIRKSKPREHIARIKITELEIINNVTKRHIVSPSRNVPDEWRVLGVKASKTRILTNGR